MKMKIIPEQSFSFEIGGVLHCGFKKVGTWEGMGKYENPQGHTVIIEEPNGFEDFMDRFLSVGVTRGKEVDVYKLSPQLMPTEDKR